MTKTRIALFASLCALTATLIACGGGGGSGGGGNPGGGGPPPTNPPTNPPAGASGNVSVSGSALANASVVYSCGCSKQAGETTTDGSGNFTLSATATATPNSPSPTYTMVPGRNYLVIGANSSTHQEGWNVLFLGNMPSHNVYMGPSGADNNDTATAAAALYIFVKSANNGEVAFDDWNFTAIQGWATELRNGAGLTAQEQKLMTDINAAEAAGKPLYPSIPSWDNDPAAVNGTILNDVNAISPASDPNIPTPCPVSGGSYLCTGTPSP
jgi:hypothetical protein